MNLALGNEDVDLGKRALIAEELEKGHGKLVHVVMSPASDRYR